MTLDPRHPQPLSGTSAEHPQAAPGGVLLWVFHIRLQKPRKDQQGEQEPL